MKKTVFLMVGMGVILALGNAGADSLRCQNQVISPGDEKADVEDICGLPSFQDSYQEERTIKTFQRVHGPPPEAERKSRAEKHDHKPEKDFFSEHEPADGYTFINEQTFGVIFDEWTYNFGPSSFIRTLKFKNDRLVSIEAGDYGFDKDKVYDFTADKGDAKAVIWLKYGPAAEIQKKVTYEITVNRREDGDYLFEEKVSRPLVEEEWTYDLGPNQYLKKLIFRDNLLVRIKTLRTKGKPR